MHPRRKKQFYYYTNTYYHIFKGTLVENLEIKIPFIKIKETFSILLHFRELLLKCNYMRKSLESELSDKRQAFVLRSLDGLSVNLNY